MQRVAFLLHIKEGCEEEYVRRHQAVWPEVLKEAEQSGIHAMSLYLTGRQVLVFMEVEDYDQAACFLSKAPASIRWEQFMASIMEDVSGGAYDPDQAWPPSLSEVFYWSASKNK